MTAELEVEVDGVYGSTSPPWQHYSQILLVGGGVGLTPWLPLIKEHHRQPHQQRQSVDSVSSQQEIQLVWVARDRTELDAMAPYLPGRDTTVFLTRASGEPPVFEAAATGAFAYNP